MTDIAKIAAGLTKAQVTAVMDGRVSDCPYNHQPGTRCPNCADWPFEKGDAAQFAATVRAFIEGEG